jgi:hypothetical protein
MPLTGLWKFLYRPIIPQEEDMTMKRTSGKLNEGEVRGKIIAHDSAKGSAPENLVLPKPTPTPPKPEK